MIPYIDLPTIELFGWFRINPFGSFVAASLVVGYFLGKRRAKALGLDPRLCGNGILWTSVLGLVAGHLAALVFYHPERILADPLRLLRIWEELSSFGGFAGGTLGAYLYFKGQGVSFLAYSEAILFGLLPAWVVARTGCAVVHDHPGKLTDFALAVVYPDGVRHDLGLYEMVYTVALTALLYRAKDYRPFPGFHFVLMIGLYTPVRFLLDFLRVGDRLYWGLTPGQYAAMIMFVASAYWAWRHRGFRPTSASPA